MRKVLIALLLIVIGLKNARAQENTFRDTITYFFKNNEMPVTTNDSAAYMRVYYPPTDSGYIGTVKEYYKDGTLKLSSKARLVSGLLLFHGECEEYFPTGIKRSVKKFSREQQIASTEYYPNGKLYAVKLFDEIAGVLYKDCYDQQGNALAKDGTGEWVEYSDDFQKVIRRGLINKYLKEGEWYKIDSDGAKQVVLYEKNKFVDKYRFDKQGVKTTEVQVDSTVVPPSYPGGIRALYKFISSNINYLHSARINTISGRVTIAFTVNENGIAGDFIVLKELGYGLDEEAIRCIKLASIWIPATNNGKPISSDVVIPVSFNFGK